MTTASDKVECADQTAIEYVRMVVGVSTWPESHGETFDIFSVQDGESDDVALQCARDTYYQELEVYIVKRPLQRGA